MRRTFSGQPQGKFLVEGDGFQAVGYVRDLSIEEEADQHIDITAMGGPTRQIVGTITRRLKLDLELTELTMDGFRTEEPPEEPQVPEEAPRSAVRDKPLRIKRD